jgi:4-amino-4-deoxy-L-arabinose transferase-like glycosyltransferase
MEVKTTIISLLFLVGLMLSPILIIRWLHKQNIKSKFIAYLLLGIVITAVLFLFFAWWTDTSNMMLLAHYGYNIDAMNETERFGQVAAENMERVKSLETSIMGIGWPLKAMMGYIVYMPYLLIIYFVTKAIRKNKNRTTPNMGLAI